MSPLLVSSLLFLVAAGGSAAPFLTKRSDRSLHLLIAFATGVFLGATFLHLLPEVAEQSRAGGHAAWLWVLAGVLGLFLLETLAFERGHPGHDDDGHHRAIGYASLFGLSVHEFTMGVALGASQASSELELPLVLSVLAHKAVESFSLTTVFLLAGFAVPRVVALAALFALVTPLGLASGLWVLPTLEASGVRAFTALATGTFLFVALCDLLPEVFHRHDDVPAKVVLVILGVAASFAPAWFGA